MSNSMLLTFAALSFDPCALPVPRPLQLVESGRSHMQVCAGLKKRPWSRFACAAIRCRLAPDVLTCFPTCIKVSPHAAMSFRACYRQSSCAIGSRKRQSCWMDWPLACTQSIASFQLHLACNYSEQSVDFTALIHQSTKLVLKLMGCAKFSLVAVLSS